MKEQEVEAIYHELILFSRKGETALATLMRIINEWQNGKETLQDKYALQIKDMKERLSRDWQKM